LLSEKDVFPISKNHEYKETGFYQMPQRGLQFAIGPHGIIKYQWSKQQQNGVILAVLFKAIQHHTKKKTQKEHEYASTKNPEIDICIPH